MTEYSKFNTVTLMEYLSKFESKLKVRKELLFPDTVVGKKLHSEREACLSELRSRGMSV